MKDIKNKYRLRRNADVPLHFTGTIIGHATELSPVNGCRQEVTLYRTSQGKLVASTFFDADFLTRPDYEAEACDSAEELIAWLREPESGKLTSLALEALRCAARQDEEILAAFGETIP